MYGQQQTMFEGGRKNERLGGGSNRLAGHMVYGAAEDMNMGGKQRECMTLNKACAVAGVKHLEGISKGKSEIYSISRTPRRPRNNA